METISIIFILTGALAMTVQLMKVIDWFEPSSPSYTRKRARHAAR